MKKERLEKFISKHQRIFSVMGVIIAVAVSALAIVFRKQLDELRNFGYLGVFLISMLGTATILFPLPGLLGAFVGGGVFHPFLVGIVGAAGAAIGELTGYFAGLGGNYFIKNSRQFKKIQDELERYGLIGIFLLSAIPNPIFDLVGIAAGVARLPVKQFLLATFAGLLVKYTLFSFLGAGWAGVFDKLVL